MINHVQSYHTNSVADHINQHQHCCNVKLGTRPAYQLHVQSVTSLSTQSPSRKERADVNASNESKRSLTSVHE